MIEQIFQAVQNEILALTFPGEPRALYDPLSYFMEMGGKRMRPFLVTYGAYMFQDRYEMALQPAIGVELFHNFSLIHDDIMDQAKIRRGKPTVHEKWDTNTAILAGDVTLVEAYQKFLQIEPIRLPKVLERFNTTAKQVCEGQQLDMIFEHQKEVSLDAYLNMIRLKTSVLVGFSLELGAMIAGASIEDTQSMYTFGEKIGMAFQIKDDFLDSFGDATKLGKRIGGDIAANKKTCLYLKTLELATVEDSNKLLNAVHLTEDRRIELVLEMYEKYNIRQHTVSLMQAYHNEALRIFEQIEAPESKKKPLIVYLNALLDRES